jgi:oxygen-independent coproporphyrinogen III oxidase
MENNQEHILLFQPPAIMQTIQQNKKTIVKKKISLYIHIPFCEKKCFFCSIVTCQKFTDEYIDNYVKVLEKEIFEFRDLFTGNTVECIHIGGGTPSLLKLEQIERIFKALDTCIPEFNDIEIVFEGEASSLTDDKIDFLSAANGKRIAINLGVQTFDNEVYRKINRWSTPDFVMDRLRRAGSKNFKSIGIDIMCNLPYSTLDTTIADIDLSIDLNINHISLYPLRVEPDSIFHDYQPKYEQAFLNDASQYELYSAAAAYLRSKGYDHYSIFHFSNMKEETYLYSRNQMYGKEWLGLGVAAYSYLNSAVFANIRDVDAYIEGGMSGNSLMLLQEGTNYIDDIIRQLVFSLRITTLTNQYYIDKYGTAVYRLFFAPLINHLAAQGFIQYNGDTFRLSDKGIVNFPKIESDLLNSYGQIIFESINSQGNAIVQA